MDGFCLFYLPMRYLSLLVFILSVQAFGADNPKRIDSLLVELDQAGNQLDKIDITFELCDAHNKYKEQLVYAKYALELCEDTKNNRYHALAYAKMGQVHYKNKEIVEAIDWCEKAIESWQRTGYRIELAEAYYDLASYYSKLGSGPDAQKWFEKSLEVYTEENNFEGVARVKNRLGILHKQLNDLTNALELYFEALKVAETHDLYELQANTLLNIGVIHKLKDEFELAQSFYQKALEKFRELDSPKGIGRTSNNLGNVYRQQGNFNLALTYYNSALMIFEEIGLKSSMAIAYNNIGLVYESQGKLSTALENYQKSLDIKLEEGAIYSVPSTYTNLASVYTQQGNYEAAERHFKIALDFANKYKLKDELSDLYKEMAEYHEVRNNTKEALKLYKKYLSYEDSLLKSENSRRLVELRAIYELSEIEQENKLLDSENQLLKAKDANDQTKRRQLQIIIIGLVVIVFLVVLLLATYYRRLRYTKRMTTALEDTNQELKETLISKEEKELLLKEIHHRVKNNLQVINSLIRLQSSKTSDEKIQDLFRECEARVKSMALVHEELYRSDDLSNVNIQEYIVKLGNDLIEAYAINKEIEFRHAVNINFMGIDTLVPLGLMINEIITNSLKHGFRNLHGGKFEIYIEIEFTDLKEYQMRIGDNGVGMPPDLNFELPDTLGIELIQTLAEQLEGTINFDTSKPGTHYIVNFKNLDIRGIIHQ